MYGFTYILRFFLQNNIHLTVLKIPKLLPKKKDEFFKAVCENLGSYF